MPGVIYVVATPIGNLADMSPRAIETLKKVDIIFAEDTRHSSQLLNYFNIATPLRAFHEHNERLKIKDVLAFVMQGKNIALIADAGTPLVSDPGYPLIEAAVQNDIQISPIPGPCAVITALSGSGLPSDRFIFEGFLPAKVHARKQYLQTLVAEPRTLIFYESPHRLMACLETMLEVFGSQREIVLAKELTKVFETFHRSTLQGLINWLKADPQRQKGEFVLLVHGDKIEKTDEDQKYELTLDEILTTLLSQVPLKQAVAMAIQLTNQHKNRVYQRALALQK